MFTNKNISVEISLRFMFSNICIEETICVLNVRVHLFVFQSLWRHRHPLELKAERDNQLQKSRDTPTRYGVNMLPDIRQSLDSIRLPSASLVSPEKRSATALEKVLRNNSATYSMRQREQKNKEISLKRAKITKLNSMSNMATQRLRLLNCSTSSSSHMRNRRDTGMISNNGGRGQHPIHEDIPKYQNDERLMYLDIRPETRQHVTFHEPQTPRQFSAQVDNRQQPVRMSLSKLRSSLKKGPYLSMSPSLAYQQHTRSNQRLSLSDSALDVQDTTSAPCNSPCHTPIPHDILISDAERTTEVEDSAEHQRHSIRIPTGT